MPLEVRELVIRTQIVTNEAPVSNAASDAEGFQDTKDIVEKCVAMVLKALDKKKDR